MQKQKIYFKQNVHYLCKLNNITISKLLELLNLPKRYTSTYGLIMISDFFNVEADWLLFNNYLQQKSCIDK